MNVTPSVRFIRKRKKLTGIAGRGHRWVIHIRMVIRLLVVVVMARQSIAATAADPFVTCLKKRENNDVIQTKCHQFLFVKNTFSIQTTNTQWRGKVLKTTRLERSEKRDTHTLARRHFLRFFEADAIHSGG